MEDKDTKVTKYKFTHVGVFGGALDKITTNRDDKTQQNFNRFLAEQYTEITIHVSKTVDIVLRHEESDMEPKYTISCVYTDAEEYPGDPHAGTGEEHHALMYTIMDRGFRHKCVIPELAAGEDKVAVSLYRLGIVTEILDMLVNDVKMYSAYCRLGYIKKEG